MLYRDSDPKTGPGCHAGHGRRNREVDFWALRSMERRRLDTLWTTMDYCMKLQVIHHTYYVYVHRVFYPIPPTSCFTDRLSCWLARLTTTKMLCNTIGKLWRALARLNPCLKQIVNESCMVEMGANGTAGSDSTGALVSMKI